MKRVLIIIILLTGTLLTYLISDFVVQGRHELNNIQSQSDFNPFTNEPVQYQEPQEYREWVEWDFNYRDLPLIMGTSVFLIGCFILLRKEKQKEIVED